MIIVSKGTASSCTLPVLQLFAVDLDINLMVDVLSAKFSINDSEGNAIETDVPVDIADCPTGHRLGVGRYVANWSGPIDADATPKGMWEIVWTYVIEDAVNGDRTFSFTRTFEVVDAGVVKNPLERFYTTLEALKLEGHTEKDTELVRLMTMASRYIEKFTGNIFEATPKLLRLDGSGTSMELLQEPIVAVANVTIDIAPFTPNDLPIDPTSIRIYNRHLSQNLMHEDDRDNPKIEFFTSFDRRGVKQFTFTHLLFLEGQQNVQIDGVFGYTEFDGTPYGSTPVLIEQAAKLLVNRNSVKTTNIDRRSKINRLSFVEELRTRDQQVKYNFPSSGGHAMVGGFTGDPEIDTILMMYQMPIQMSAT